MLYPPPHQFSFDQRWCCVNRAEVKFTPLLFMIRRQLLAVVFLILDVVSIMSSDTNLF